MAQALRRWAVLGAVVGVLAGGPAWAGGPAALDDTDRIIRDKFVRVAFPEANRARATLAMDQYMRAGKTLQQLQKDGPALIAEYQVLADAQQEVTSSQSPARVAKWCADIKRSATRLVKFVDQRLESMSTCKDRGAELDGLQLSDGGDWRNFFPRVEPEQFARELEGAQRGRVALRGQMAEQASVCAQLRRSNRGTY